MLLIDLIYKPANGSGFGTENLRIEKSCRFQISVMRDYPSAILLVEMKHLALTAVKQSDFPREHAGLPRK